MTRLISYLESVISGEQCGVFPAILKACLLPISWLSLVVMRSRRWLYSKKILPGKRLPCKVISVGNIVVGGSGKTPAVMYVARILRDRANLNMAVLSRGYRSKIRGAAVVSDGVNVLLDHLDAGDEPHILALNLPGVPVLIGKDRMQTGLLAIRKWNCGAAILDDGFQYLRLSRDIDIITMDATRPFGFGHILPRGYLREPLSVLNRADAILLTRVDQCSNLDSVRDKLAKIAPSVPIFESIYRPGSLYSLDKHQEMGLDSIKGRNILAVCGIANPLSFAETLHSLGPSKVTLLPFPDHHAYPHRSIEMIERRAEELEVNFIVTTEKDGPKLGAINASEVLILTVELEVVRPTADSFAKFVLEVLMRDES